jgi:4-hydroxybenzoate polyprenyltransferase
MLTNAYIAFIAFSLSASAIYTLNDYLDIEEDRRHPKKRNRPLASGAITKSQAIAIIATLLVAGLSTIFIFFSSSIHTQYNVIVLFIIYIILNVAYSLYLKHVAILDVVIISIGFVLRLFIGSAVTGILLSKWIIIMTFLLALFLALAKRRDDVLIYLDTGKKMRKVIDGYNLQFLNIAMAIMASVVIVAYIMYTTSSDVVEKVQSDHLYVTALFVILGIVRYLQIAFVYKDSGSPTKIVLKDHFIQLTLLGWIISFICILYRW